MLTWLKNKFARPSFVSATNDSSALPEGTYVTADELIALQASAGKTNINHLASMFGNRAGQHVSRFRGRGMDYQESRAYQAGDDIRHIDWRVTARTGKPHSKIYQEERERPLVLLVDLGASMFFGSRKVLKSVIAMRLAALLAWMGAKNGDRIGALLINGEHKEIEPKQGKHGVLGLIRELVSFSQHACSQTVVTNSHLNDELVRLRRLAKPGSLIVLISDFYQVDDVTENHLLRLQQHNNLIAIQVVDPIEMNVPVAGEYAVTDGVHIARMDMRSKQARENYQHFFKARYQALNTLMQKHKIPLLTISTQDDVVDALNAHVGQKPTIQRLAS